MTVLAMINPTSLVGKDLREALERHPRLWTELRLLSAREEEVGQLTEVRGGAAIVQGYEAGALEGTDLVYLCGALADVEAPLADLPPGSSGVILSADAPAERAPAIVAGINLEEALGESLLISPHPAAIALAHLLRPLADLAPAQAVATVLQPASMRDQEGLDELFEQTRAVLAFRPKKPQRVFGHQLAFNLLPARSSSAHLAGLVASVLGSRYPIAAHAVQGGFFHGLAVHLFVELGPGAEPEEVRERLAGSPAIELVEDPELLGPITAAGRDELLVGDVLQDPSRPNAYWIWAVLDNLTLGAANNALAITQALLRPGVVS